MIYRFLKKIFTFWCSLLFNPPFLHAYTYAQIFHSLPSFILICEYWHSHVLPHPFTYEQTHTHNSLISRNILRNTNTVYELYLHFMFEILKHILTVSKHPDRKSEFKYLLHSSSCNAWSLYYANALSLDLSLLNHLFVCVSFYFFVQPVQ